jgi:hypothetical protein
MSLHFERPMFAYLEESEETARSLVKKARISWQAEPRNPSPDPPRKVSMRFVSKIQTRSFISTQIFSRLLLVRRKATLSSLAPRDSSLSPSKAHDFTSKDNMEAGKVPVKLVKVTRVLGRTGTSHAALHGEEFAS